MNAPPVEISAIVPVNDRYEPTGTLAREYLEALDATGRSFELIYVLDTTHRDLVDELKKIADGDSRLRIFQLVKSFGESAAISAGIANTHSSVVLTLPAYYQIEAGEIGKVLAEVDRCDMAICMRWPRAAASGLEVIRRKLFHWLVNRVTGSSFSDLGCGVRAFKRSIASEVPMYGDQHRFLAVLAFRRGFHVHELQVRQSERDRYDGGYGPRVYAQRLLDIFTVFFLVRFTKKPLRFFGMIGSVMFVSGASFLLYIIGERLVFDIGLADRPALLLSSLLVVLGLQIFALGLLGELIIFTHGQDAKEYTIEKILN